MQPRTLHRLSHTQPRLSHHLWSSWICFSLQWTWQKICFQKILSSLLGNVNQLILIISLAKYSHCLLNYGNSPLSGLHSAAKKSYSTEMLSKARVRVTRGCSSLCQNSLKQTELWDIAQHTSLQRYFTVYLQIIIKLGILFKENIPRKF